VGAEGGEDGGEDDDEDGADDVFADADDAVFAGVAVFHTHRIAPWRIPVNTPPAWMWEIPHRGFDGQRALAPRIPRRLTVARRGFHCQVAVSPLIPHMLQGRVSPPLTGLFLRASTQSTSPARAVRYGNRLPEVRR